MRQAARAQASALPAYPVFQNKDHYEQLNPEEQLEYREQATLYTLASEARRRMLVDTVGRSILLQRLATLRNQGSRQGGGSCTVYDLYEAQQ